MFRSMIWEIEADSGYKYHVNGKPYTFCYSGVSGIKGSYHTINPDGKIVGHSNNGFFPFEKYRSFKLISFRGQEIGARLLPKDS